MLDAWSRGTRGWEVDEMGCGDRGAWVVVGGGDGNGSGNVTVQTVVVEGDGLGYGDYGGVGRVAGRGNGMDLGR